MNVCICACACGCCSGLPAVLHQRGFELHPLTLEVGDYVLSPEMCVERKAIPDLHSSLASGRCAAQVDTSRACSALRVPVYATLDNKRHTSAAPHARTRH